MITISQRLQNIPASGIRKLVPLAQKAKADGVTVYHLNIGDPDIKSPPEMMEAIKTWERNPIGYGNSQGEPEILEALTGYYQGLGYRFVSKEQIQVTVGGSEALAMAMMATCEVGDELIVFEPFFTGYAGLAAVYGVKLVPVTTTIENGFHLPTRTQIEQKITERTRAILFTNPNNPTGTVFSQAEVEMLVDIAKKKDLYLLSDEVYREMVFDGRVQVSLIKYMPEQPDRIVVLDSLSKRYCVCGLRLGMLVSLNQELMAGVLRMAMARLSAGLIDQVVGSRLAKVGENYILSVRDEYQQRRDVVYEGLAKIPGVTIQRPEGAFYAVVGLPVKDAEAFCAWLLTDFRDNRETVMLAPMAGFYATPHLGQNEVRIAYVLKIEKLKRAMEILTKALATFSEK
jgi:aspartate aminotransferase